MIYQRNRARNAEEKANIRRIWRAFFLSIAAGLVFGGLLLALLHL